MIDQRVLDYVKKTYNSGFDEEHIRIYLSSRGISKNELDEAFDSIRQRLGFFEKVMLAFKDPNRLFDSIKQEPLKDSMIYFLKNFIVYSMLILIPLYIDRYLNQMKGFRIAESIIGNHIIIVLGTFLIIFFFSIILDCFTHYFNGKGIHENFRIMAYAMTPLFLFLWIPYFGAVISFYSIFPMIIGIKKLHEFTLKKSVASLILTISTTIVILLTINMVSYYP